MKIEKYEHWTLGSEKGMEDRYVINTSSEQWLENNIEDWDLVYDIVKKHNGYIVI